jgi:hypothetical protein
VSDVEIMFTHGMLLLRARNSELLILPQHVEALQKMTGPKEFSDYFKGQALINRPARKLFEAWLKKDATLWKRIFTTLQDNIPDSSSTVAAQSK